MAAEMVDFAIVLIGIVCLASILVGRHLFLGTPIWSIETAAATTNVVHQRRFTRFMHINLTVAGSAIVIVLLSQAPRLDPQLSVSVEPITVTVVN